MPSNLLDSKLEKSLNDAVESELYASHLYKHVANQMQRVGYFGAQKFFLHESADELEHYQKHVDFLNDCGTCAKVPGLPAMPKAIKTMRDALETAYDTELQLREDYKKWYAAASSDPTVQQHLLQFLQIQTKSVGEYGDLLARLDRVNGDACGILMIDKELGE